MWYNVPMANTNYLEAEFKALIKSKMSAVLAKGFKYKKVVQGPYNTRFNGLYLDIMIDFYGENGYLSSTLIAHILDDHINGRREKEEPIKYEGLTEILEKCGMDPRTFRMNVINLLENDLRTVNRSFKNIDEYLTVRTVPYLVEFIKERECVGIFHHTDEKKRLISSICRVKQLERVNNGHSDTYNTNTFEHLVKALEDSNISYISTFCNSVSSKIENIDEFFKQCLVRDFAPVVITSYIHNHLTNDEMGSIIDIYAEDYSLSRFSLELTRNRKELSRFSLDGKSTIELTAEEQKAKNSDSITVKGEGDFVLTGRKELSDFFNNEVVDIVRNIDVYERFGISFPEPFILEGPPGCGKTYAVDRLTEFLGWETFHITSGNVGSTFIHDTSKKIEETFAEAGEKNGAVIVIDEMDAFMPDRSGINDTGNHHFEEVASFLKCIQSASSNRILVVGMTNLIKNIDPAILRTGRMGKHIKVAMASKEEIIEVINAELKKRPHSNDIKIDVYAEHMINRPLSDVTALVRSASMVAAKERADELTNKHFEISIKNFTKKERNEEKRVCGFHACA